MCLVTLGSWSGEDSGGHRGPGSCETKKKYITFFLRHNQFVPLEPRRARCGGALVPWGLGHHLSPGLTAQPRLGPPLAGDVASRSRLRAFTGYPVEISLAVPQKVT